MHMFWITKPTCNYFEIDSKRFKNKSPRKSIGGVVYRFAFEVLLFDVMNIIYAGILKLINWYISFKMIYRLKRFSNHRKYTPCFNSILLYTKQSRHVGFLASTYVTHVTSILADFFNIGRLFQYWPTFVNIGLVCILVLFGQKIPY